MLNRYLTGGNWVVVQAPVWHKVFETMHPQYSFQSQVHETPCEKLCLVKRQDTAINWRARQKWSILSWRLGITNKGPFVPMGMAWTSLVLGPFWILCPILNILAVSSKYWSVPTTSGWKWFQWGVPLSDLYQEDVKIVCDTWPTQDGGDCQWYCLH